jgi:hypothetical protein
MIRIKVNSNIPASVLTYKLRKDTAYNTNGWTLEQTSIPVYTGSGVEGTLVGWFSRDAFEEYPVVPYVGTLPVSSDHRTYFSRSETGIVVRIERPDPSNVFSEYFVLPEDIESLTQALVQAQNLPACDNPHTKIRVFQRKGSQTS